MNQTFPKPVDRPLTVAALLDSVRLPTLSVTGDTQLKISSIANPGNAEPGSLVFVMGDGPKAAALLAETRATVVALEMEAPARAGRCYIRSADPRFWFLRATQVLFADEPGPPVHPTAVIDPAAKLGPDCRVGPFAVIEAGAELGEGCRIAAHAVIRARTVIGDRTIVQPHATIGGEGLSIHRDLDGDLHVFPHHGRALVGSDVVIGAHSTIARGMLQDTVIGNGSKLGNFVNVGHNCTIGANCWVSANVILCGAARLEDEVRLAASVSVSDHVTIGRGARIGLGSVVTKDVPPGAVMFGNPAKPLRTMRSF